MGAVALAALDDQRKPPSTPDLAAG
jgi:hypothetical protein